MKTNRSVIIGLGLLAASGILPAQSLVTSFQSSGTDSVVSVVADQQGLQQVPPDQVPVNGTFWLVEPGGAAAPMPGLPPGYSSCPVYAITDGGEFLVDASGGQILVRAPAGQSVTSDMISSAVTVEANAVANIINNVQDAQFEGQMRMLADAAGMDVPLPGGFGDGDDGSYPPFSGGTPINTNGLWLAITNYDGNFAYLNLNNANDQVYAAWVTTNLLGGWQVAAELWPAPAQTNVLPFTVPTLGQPNLFVRAEDWTGVTENGNTTPEWYFFYWYGPVNFSDMSDTNLDSNGNTLLSDYQNYTNGTLVDPNIIQFSVAVTNNYVNSMSVPVQLNITAGLPSYAAVSVDDTNYAADAGWQTFTGTNLAVNLGLIAGWHDVWIGLKGCATNADATWEWVRLNLSLAPPALVITNPVGGTVDIPMIQVQGYSPVALSSISYDLSNAVETVTNQQALVLNQNYDTNTWEFTTNTFQAFDVVLTNGVNTFTLHATDRAGDLLTLVTNFTLDYSAKTNPPAVQVAWPSNDTQVSGSSFTVNGQVGDPTITVSATITDTNGDTNIVNGLVERTGKFWVENLPLNSGTNTVTLTVTDVAGNVTTNSFNVVQSTVTLTVTPVTPSSQLWQPFVNLTGTVSDPTYAIWVNGVKGHNNGDGTWSASNVPVNSGGTASFTVTGYAPAEQQPDGSYGN